MGQLGMFCKLTGQTIILHTRVCPSSDQQDAGATIMT